MLLTLFIGSYNLPYRFRLRTHYIGSCVYTMDSRISNLCIVIFFCPWPTIGKTAYKLLEIYGILKEAESTMIKYVRL